GFGGKVGGNGVRALADVGRATQHADATATVGAKDDAGMRHAVPVDGRARARHVRRARESDTAPLRPAPPRGGLPAAPLVSPARCLDHLVDALTEANG